MKTYLSKIEYKWVKSRAVSISLYLMKSKYTNANTLKN